MHLDANLARAETDIEIINEIPVHLPKWNNVPKEQLTGMIREL